MGSFFGNGLELGSSSVIDQLKEIEHVDEGQLDDLGLACAYAVQLLVLANLSPETAFAQGQGFCYVLREFSTAFNRRTTFINYNGGVEMIEGIKLGEILVDGEEVREHMVVTFNELCDFISVHGTEKQKLQAKAAEKSRSAKFGA